MSYQFYRIMDFKVYVKPPKPGGLLAKGMLKSVRFLAKVWSSPAEFPEAPSANTLQSPGTVLFWLLQFYCMMKCLHVRTEYPSESFIQYPNEWV